MIRSLSYASVCRNTGTPSYALGTLRVMPVSTSENEKDMAVVKRMLYGEPQRVLDHDQLVSFARQRELSPETYAQRTSAHQRRLRALNELIRTGYARPVASLNSFSGLTFEARDLLVAEQEEAARLTERALSY